ncbi:MAG: hypothetical protein A2298_03620 [Gammaproteobacteria bacterium RIFOXYB2_FULL_38_6]|nr:MAG: hypothetical protein A2298_03620 [Gammaproteobacteria bacterium RIFOXYB2_FULL_38_6]
MTIWKKNLQDNANSHDYWFVCQNSFLLSFLHDLQRRIKAFKPEEHWNSKHFDKSLLNFQNEQKINIFELILLSFLYIEA